MVSRRTRSYKEKRTVAIFGQFMLPLAVIMAIALLYFSMKLFFLTTSTAKRSDESAGQPVSADAAITMPAVPAGTPKPQELPASPKLIAGPVGEEPAQAPAVKPVVPKGPEAQKTPPKAANVPAATQQTKPQAKPPATASKPAEPLPPRRYDVQIGAFAARDNALQLVRKARGQGYDVYINEAVQEGSPYFRVRVKGPAARQDVQALSKKLEAQGYPVYIVAIN